MTRCPECGYTDESKSKEHGYEMLNDDEILGTSQSGGSDFKTSLTRPGKEQMKCPRCGEEF